MKKTFFFLALLLMGAAGWSTLTAQTQTISSATVEFNYCQETEETINVEIATIPGDWNGYHFETEGLQDLIIESINDAGCPHYTKFNVSKMTHLPGKFTVNSSGKQVYFAPGNLQFKEEAGGAYSITLGNVRTVIGSLYFAENQWTVLGQTPNTSTTAPVNRDLFDVGSAWTTYRGKVISGAGSSSWDMLTNDEWNWLLKLVSVTGRDNATNLRGAGTVNGVQGLIILPDDWVLPGGCSFSATIANFTTNTYTIQQWKEMEKAGAVFLPGGGGLQNALAWNPYADKGNYCQDVKTVYQSSRTTTYYNRLSFKPALTSVSNETSNTSFFSVRMVQTVQ